MPDNIEKITYPSLSPDGFVFSSIQQADSIMASFLASDANQSYLFDNRIASLGSIVAKYGNSHERLSEVVTSTLTDLFSRYFNNVVVECNDATKPEEPSKGILSLFVEFTTASGETSNISRLTLIKGSRLKAINDIITNGD